VDAARLALHDEWGNALMSIVLIDSDDLGEAEESLSAAFARVRIGAGTPGVPWMNARLPRLSSWGACCATSWTIWPPS
jgi:hypothetical protein